MPYKLFDDKTVTKAFSFSDIACGFNKRGKPFVGDFVLAY